MTRWLNEDEQRAWRAWVAAATLLPDRLDRDLQEKWGYSMADYIILMTLSEAPEHRLRMSELADATLASRSRLSHQIDRLRADGLVDRRPCEDDRRGAYAVLTPAGLDLLRSMSHDHVESVRTHLVDRLDPEQFTELGRLSREIAEPLKRGKGWWWEERI